MKVSHKVVLISSTIVVITFTLFSWLQYNTVKNALHDKAASNVAETSRVISTQIADWLNGKLALIDMVANTIDADYSAETIQKSFDNPILADNFILMFGGLHTDGKPITNDPSWAPTGWDARKRPWYDTARNSSSAALTPPYEDASTKEILISAVANFSDQGKFLGAFGGDLSLKVIADAINKVNFNETGYAFLISADGNIISHPDVSLNGQSLSALFPQKRPTTNSQFQEIEVDGQMMFTAFQPLEGLQGTQWLIGVMLEKNKVLKEANAFGFAAIIGTLISVLLTAMALFITMKSLFKPLERLQQSLLDINSGDGDLTKRLVATSGDEFGKVSTDFNEFVQYLQDIIINVKRISGELTSNTSDSSASANQSATVLARQLGELDMLSAAINQMSCSAQEVANSAQEAAASAKAAERAADEGTAIVSQTSKSIAQLVTDMDETVDTVNQLEKYSANIESVLTSITSIAEQTNLLALNAAIEAARAGDMGRGFAVVADEVRALAARTQQSTNETSLIIEQLQQGVKEAVERIEQSRNLANKTNEEATKADVILNDIRTSISHINDISVNIASAAQQQSATSEEINRNTTTIRDISQEVSVEAHNQSDLCTGMVDIIEQQNKVLEKFKV
ncbi:MAG: methyl-accepting chemotaxis protein [Pseudomonadales bacterium]|nr:methyl-accepting chemotaxis protein [Pseudomonadales bacterium]NRA17695.1 methyl-accepting chemotaxis protein [Oceanospirillaceae bacterium]